MPNGGVHHCGNCRHYQQDTSSCELRGVRIESSHWTTCKNFGQPNKDAIGPIYAIVCEVKSHAGSYADIPYCDGIRVDTVQRPDGGDTFVCFRDSNGQYNEYPTVADYLAFYETSGRKY
jgi:hypothetical protein